VSAAVRKGRWRARLAKVAVAVVFAYAALVVADGLLRLTPANVHVGRYERNRAAAARAGVTFDTRTGWQVIHDLRAEGRDAVPFVTPAHFERGDLDPLSDGGEPLLPLGGISRATTVACNETGAWMVYDADEHGFNNPTGLYGGRPAVVVVGDSFAHGTCLPRGEEFVSLLRGAWGGGVVGVATHGSGPIAMLAQVREYAARLSPSLVLWFYYEGNDVTTDVRREAAHPVLRRYLEPTFSQRLFDRQATIDRLIRQQIALPQGEARPAAEASWGDAAAAALALREIRVLGTKALGRTVRLEPFRERWFDEQYAAPLRRFEEALRTARDEVRGWGGRLVFVYLPSWDAFHARWMDGVMLKPDVLRIVENLSVSVVDVEPAFRALDDPSEAFVFGLPNHYGETGNRAVADAVLGALPGIARGRDLPDPVQSLDALPDLLDESP
jgi:hypothetical protein